jgi:hypothetical protein
MERCPFCGGNYVKKSYGVRCLMCDRSPDIEYERYVMREKKKEHRNWHIYQTTKWRNRYEEYTSL